MKRSRKYDTSKYLIQMRKGDMAIEKRVAGKCESLPIQIYNAYRPDRTKLSNPLLNEIQEEYEHYYA